MITETILALSIVINVTLVLYARWILKNYKEIVVAMDNIGEMIAQYVVHLKSVYELEMFYGDETLSSLLQHGREIVEKLEDIQLLGEEEENEDTEEDTDENTDQ